MARFRKMIALASIGVCIGATAMTFTSAPGSALARHCNHPNGSNASEVAKARAGC